MIPLLPYVQHTKGPTVSAPPPKKTSDREITCSARKELIQFCPRDFFMIDAFLSPGNIVGLVIFTWGKYGVSICRVVTSFEITVLGVPKLQKNNTPKCRITCHTLPERSVGLS